MSRLSLVRRSLLVVPLAIALAAPTGLALAQSVSVQHSSGETSVPVNPSKVITLDWAIVDTLKALDVKVSGVPSSTVPAHLSEFVGDDYIQAGTVFEPDFEVLKSAQPDLILLGRRSQPHYEEAAKYGTTIDLTPDPNDLLGSVVRNTTILGEIFGRQERARELTERLEASVAQLNQLTADKGDGLLVLTTGGRMAAFGKGTRFGMIHDVFGVEQAVEKLEAGRHGQSVSFEYLLEANPDWLFVMDRDAAIGREGVAARQLMDNELIRATSAGEKDQIVYLDPVNWYLLDNSGIGVMQESVDSLIQVFSAAQ